ncbi:hypothetical protein VTN77DRAFT_8013 [Rasamsonia byssochlamydoides]|uniref:uncharacterized protein n=1 Tax=Rasamsonia byssochlamydoides TaxID=89139 RepID=UPI0037431840
MIMTFFPADGQHMSFNSVVDIFARQHYCRQLGHESRTHCSRYIYVIVHNLHHGLRMPRSGGEFPSISTRHIQILFLRQAFSKEGQGSSSSFESHDCPALILPKSDLCLLQNPVSISTYLSTIAEKTPEEVTIWIGVFKTLSDNRSIAFLPFQVILLLEDRNPQLLLEVKKEIIFPSIGEVIIRRCVRVHTSNFATILWGHIKMATYLPTYLDKLYGDKKFVEIPFPF